MGGGGKNIQKTGGFGYEDQTKKRSKQSRAEEKEATVWC